MRRPSGAFVSVVSFCLVASAFAAEPPTDVPPTDYFAGQYELVGRKPGSIASYSGTIELKLAGNGQFVMIRKIAGHENKGTAFLDQADPPANHPPVLRIRFSEGGDGFEGTFLWRSDLDNYPRLTGLIYRRLNGKTKSAGLEAWFAAATLRR